MIRFLLRFVLKLLRVWGRQKGKEGYYKSAHWHGLRAEMIKPWSTCVDCGKMADRNDPLQLDHNFYYTYIPSLGRRDSVYFHEREVPGCLSIRHRSCHQKRHGRTF